MVNLSKKYVYHDKYSSETDAIEWTPFLRQVLVVSSTCIQYFCIGMVTGAPTVTIPQLRRSANVTGPLSDDMASWLSSVIGYAAIPCIFLIIYGARTYGRKKTYIFIGIWNIGAFVAFYCSSSPIHLLVSLLLFGMTQASASTTNIIIITEYTSPQYRGVFLCVKSATALWGVWVANTIGAFAHYSYIALFGLICSLYSLTAFFWPESPHWLASRRRFAECRAAHRLLNGRNKASERALIELIESYTNCDDAPTFSIKSFTRREFYKPLLISMSAVALYMLSGKHVVTVYAVDILKKIVDDDATVVKSMLLLDGITVFSMYLGCYLGKIMKRRTLLLTASTAAVMFMSVLSLYLYLVKLTVLNEKVYVSIFLLMAYSLSISCGPIILCTSVYGELIPFRYKSVSVIIIAVEFACLFGTLLKTSPLLFRAFGIHGTFLFFAVASAACVILLYLYLPETKDRTLVEIEQYFRDKKVVEESRELMS